MADCPSRSLTGSSLLHRARHVHDPLAEEERARRHHQVAEEGAAALREVAGEEDHDAGIGEQHARQLGNGEPVAGDEEVREEHGVHRV